MKKPLFLFIFFVYWYISVNLKSLNNKQKHHEHENQQIKEPTPFLVVLCIYTLYPKTLRRKGRNKLPKMDRRYLCLKHKNPG